MAVIEIAKIQIRRGQENITGIPTLSPGEFGWAEDTEHLYIGKSVAGGAVNNHNTRILTENDVQVFYNGVVSTTTAYSFQGHIPGYPAQNTVTRSLQDKIDDNVSVLDFGAVGDGVTPNAIPLQAAIDNLYLTSLVKNNGSRQSKMVVKIPAGVYQVENTIYVPPYVTLQGEGKGNTVLNLTTGSASLIQFVDQQSTIGSPYVKFVDGQVYIGPTHPSNITINGMTLQYDTSISTTGTLSLVRADCATDCVISDVQFLGTYTVANSQIGNSNYTGIDIRGQGLITTKDLIIDNCNFDNLYYGIKSNYDIEDCIITKSRFRNLNRAITFAESIASINVTGPLRTRIENNKFYYIEREGIFVGSNSSNYPTHHVSAFNIFRNVGNNAGSDAVPVTPVINYQPPGNVSIGDYTSRFDYINNTSTEITSLTSLFVNGISYVESAGVYTAAISATPNTTLVKFPFSGTAQSTRIQYNVTKAASNILRTGELLINASYNGSTSTALVTDRYSFTGANDGNITFSASLNTTTNLVSLNYTSADAIGSITYKYSQLSNV
jgi:hypothetical protein